MLSQPNTPTFRLAQLKFLADNKTTMAKKRKASGRPYGRSEAREVRDADAKIKPIQSFEDVANSEDEFHVNRDKILLEDTAEQKRRRRWKEEGAFVRYMLALGLRIRCCC
jgi:hypothetical protein